MSGVLPAWTAALGAAPWLMAAGSEQGPHLPHGAELQGAPWDDTLEWELHDWAFDSTTMVGARLAQPAAADEALLPLRAVPAVHLPPPCDADEPARAQAGTGQAAPKTKTGRRVYSARPAVCQVPGCGQALAADGHAYCFRYRICEMHLRDEKVHFEGSGGNRFCQKCSTLHPLEAFSGSNRTCARQLAAKAARHRALKAPPVAAQQPTSSGSRSQSAMSTPTASASPPAASCDPQAEFFQFCDMLLADGSAALPAAARAAPDDARAAALAAWGGSQLPAVRMCSLKLDQANPGSIPPALAPALARAWCDDVGMCIEAAPRPGCTLLHIDALVCPDDAPPAPDALRLLRDLLASSAGAWLRARAVMLRTSAGDGAAAGPGSASASPAVDVALPPRPPQLQPLALLSTASATLRAPGWTGPPPGCQLWLRLNGQVMKLQCNVSGAVTLPALEGAEGAAHIWLAKDGTAGGASRTVLLTRDAAIAAEVASANVDDEGTQQLLCAIGAALRPSCAPRVLAAATAEALSRGWVAVSSRLLPLLRATLDSGAADADACLAARRTLHAAALSGRPELAQLTLSLPVDGKLGAPNAQHGRVITPMHLAAMAGDGGTAAVLAGATPASLVAWFCVRNAEGATPADVACGSAAATHAALMRRLSNARMLAAELAAAGHDAADSAAAAATAQLFDDAALARFLLRIAAPSDPAAPAAPGERALYEQQRFMRHRLWSLCFPPFVFVAIVRRILVPIPIAIVAPPALPTFHQAWAMYLDRQQLPRMLVVLAMHLSMICVVTLPKLRRVCESHGVVVLRIFSVLQFIVLPAVAEVRVRKALGFAVLWPVVEGSLFAASITINMALLPLPCRDILALLAARWVQMVVARMTGAPIWPGVTNPLQAALTTTLLHAVLTIAVVIMDRRAWAAWRMARRSRLANALPLMRKQA